jgi:hypothetical protein
MQKLEKQSPRSFQSGRPDWANFSPIGQLFKLGIFYYIHNLPTFLGRKSLFRNFDKKVFGYILGDFLKNSSGHPDASVDKKSLDAFCKRIIGN